MNKITPFLWFDNNAEEAMNFYAAVFKDAEIVSGNYFQLLGLRPAVGRLFTPLDDAQVLKESRETFHKFFDGPGIGEKERAAFEGFGSVGGEGSDSSA